MPASPFYAARLRPAPASYALLACVCVLLLLQVRAYNGSCYEWGSVSRTDEKFKVRPQDEVRFDLDFDEADGVMYMR